MKSYSSYIVRYDFSLRQKKTNKLLYISYEKLPTHQHHLYKTINGWKK